MRTAYPLLALALVACATTPADQYRAILPDDRLVIEGFGDSALARGVGDPSDYYALTRDITRDVNAGIGDVLGLVDAITSFEPTWTDEASTALWGPWLDDGITVSSGSRRPATAASTGRSAPSRRRPGRTAWVPVLAGHVDAGGDETHSVGWFVLDFTAADSVGAGDDELGGWASSTSSSRTARLRRWRSGTSRTTARSRPTARTTTSRPSGRAG